MIKVISNLSNNSSTPKIDIECKMIRKSSNSYVFVNPVNPGGDYKKYYELDEDRTLFVKLSYSGLSSTNTVAKGIFYKYND